MVLDHAHLTSRGLIGYQSRIVSPVLSDHSIEIVGGDDYTGASAIAMPRATWAGEDLTARRPNFGTQTAGARRWTGSWEAIGEVSITPGAGVVDASVELDEGDTPSFDTLPARKYHYVYQLVTQRGASTRFGKEANGEIVIYADGDLIVRTVRSGG